MNESYTFNYTAASNGTVTLLFKLLNSYGGISIQNNYFLDDVKVTDITTTNTPLMLAYKDYYPFGMPMPVRNIEGEYRYAYEGQEKDAETGMEAFELRLWDARIGRWLTTDPYGQYNSPYLGMGNNPISSIDSDGGWETKWGRFWGWVGNGFQGKFTDNENVTGANKYGISFDYGGGPGEGELTGSYTANSRSGLDSWNSNQEWGNWRFTENGQGFEAAMMQGSNLNWGDRWSHGNFAQQAVYGTANSFSIVGQSMNPFDNQVTSIAGEGLNGTDRSIYGAEVAATLLPVGAAGNGARYGLGSLINRTAGLDYRITTRGWPGIGQRDIGHRAATFFRKEILTQGKIEIQAYNNILFKHSIGNRNFSIAFNPLKWRIFHEGPF